MPQASCLEALRLITTLKSNTAPDWFRRILNGQLTVDPRGSQLAISLPLCRSALLFTEDDPSCKEDIY